MDPCRLYLLEGQRCEDICTADAVRICAGRAPRCSPRAPPLSQCGSMPPATSPRSTRYASFRPMVSSRIRPARDRRAPWIVAVPPAVSLASEFPTYGYKSRAQLPLSSFDSGMYMSFHDAGSRLIVPTLCMKMANSIDCCGAVVHTLSGSEMNLTISAWLLRFSLVVLM